MANVKVIEKNVGPKIEYEQSGTRLYFGDDEIMVNCSKYQKDWEQTVDICMDRVGNLTIGTRSALRYVAQIEIPAKEYTEEEVDGEIQRTPVPLDMGDVTLILWAIE